MIKKLSFLLVMTAMAGYAQDDDYRPVNFALEFLEIESDVRLGGYGEVGVVASSLYPDAGLSQNPALLARNGRHAGINLSWMPWYRNLVSGISVSGLNAFYSIDKKSAVGYNFKYMHYGEIDIYSSPGNFIGSARMYMFSHQITYARLLLENLRVGAGVKYIRSYAGRFDLPGGYEMKPINTVAVDLGAEYALNLPLSHRSSFNLRFGAAIRNFGPKVSGTTDPDVPKSFLPTSLGLGILVNPDLYYDDRTRINLELSYQADKYLVPSTPVYDNNGGTLTIVDGKDPDISPFRAVYQSFYDAPDGFSEEMHEILHKIGLEFRANIEQHIYIALRAGAVIQHETKGPGKYRTLGAGLGVYGFTVDYKRIFSQNPALDKTWALAIGFRTNLDRMFRF